MSSETPIIPVPANLQFGAETAQWVLDQILTYPQTYDQQHWESENDACGTTYCVAGWASYAHRHRPVMKHNGDWAGAGMEALGISDIDVAYFLFRSCRTPDEVIRGLKCLANGDPVELEA